MSTSYSRRLGSALLVLALATSPFAAAAQESGAASSLSELRLDAALIQEFLQVIYFADGGRFHFKEYSDCSYEFIQNPVVSIDGGLVRVGAEYFRRRGTPALGGCAGIPGTSTNVTLVARPSAEDSALALEVLEVRTETLPELTAMLLQLAGVTLPMTQQFDLMAALNDILYENQPFGIVSLQIHELLVEDESVLLRLTMRLGIW